MVTTDQETIELIKLSKSGLSLSHKVVRVDTSPDRAGIADRLQGGSFEVHLGLGCLKTLRDRVPLSVGL